MDKTLGIIGGGQLGKMLLQYCSTINVTTYVYDPSENSPCKNMSTKFFNGGFMDHSKLIEFGRKCDIITYELEHINIDALQQLESEGIPVYPTSDTLKIIQNKWRQKCFFMNNSIPTSNFHLYETIKQIKQDIEYKKIELPFVWKKTTFGYDGFGVKIIKNISDLDNITDGECIIEDYVPIQTELSVIIARNPNKESRSYPPVEMIFNNDSNQVEYVFEPAQISQTTYDEVMKIAKKVSLELDHVGVLAIELFLTKEGNVLVNEVAPRPHNSGHLTIEQCCPTSQFEQHIRCVLNLPLGETIFTDSAIMMNIVGEEMYYLSQNINDIFESKNTYLHNYGKDKIKPNRKMGHITIVGGDNLINRAKNLKENTMKSKSKTADNVVINISEPTFCVGIIMGSISDLPIMKEAITVLKELDVKTETDIVSAHRTPEEMMEYGKTAHKRGISVIIAGAGGAAHLPGMIASLTPLPVIGVPIKSSNSIDGWDSVLSILQMPSGVPVATVALNGAKNAGILSATIIGINNRGVQERILAFKQQLKTKVYNSKKILKQET